MSQKIQRVSIKGMLCRDGKVLALKSGNGIWELPGGGMDFGENVEQAFKREMEEELGFKSVRLGKFINIWSFISMRDGIDHHFIILDFEIFTDEEDIKLSKEHMEYKWIGIEDLDGLDMREGYKESIKKYFEGR